MIIAANKEATARYDAIGLMSGIVHKAAKSTPGRRRVVEFLTT